MVINCVLLCSVGPCTSRWSWGGVAPIAAHTFLKWPAVPAGTEFECQFARCPARKDAQVWAIADRILDVVFEKGFC